MPWILPVIAVLLWFDSYRFATGTPPRWAAQLVAWAAAAIWAVGGGVPIPAQGTSAATPLWAAVIALADQDAGQHLGFVNPAIYAIARSPAYHRA